MKKCTRGGRVKRTGGSVFPLLAVMVTGGLLNVNCGDDCVCPVPDDVPEITVVTWNAHELFTPQDVEERRNDLRSLVEDLRPNILVLQEVTSKSVVDAVREAAGLSDYSIAWSDFTQNDGGGLSALEVAVIAKHSLGEIVEYDQTPDNRPDEDDPSERQLKPPAGIPIEDIAVQRGFLWVDIPSLRVIVVAVHLKSSVGSTGLSDADNARKRELVSAAIAAEIADCMALCPDYTYLVAGDFNVGHWDCDKNGTDLASDCYEDCAGLDRYDETHALLRDGLVDGLRMRNLCDTIGSSTYPGYDGTPIDDIYAAGTMAGDFSYAVKAGGTYGSDHLPVIATTGAGTCERPPGPVAEFIASPTSGDPPLKVEFVDLSTDAMCWEWDFGDGAGSAERNPTHEYTAGTYSVSLAVTSSRGSDTKTKTDYITVAHPPQTYISAVLADPEGSDALKEAVWLTNSGSTLVSLDGWHLEDSVGSRWSLSADGSIPAGDTLEIVRNNRPMSINNDGDILKLFDSRDNLIDSVRFGPQEEGVIVRFPDPWSPGGLMESKKWASQPMEAWSGRAFRVPITTFVPSAIRIITAGKRGPA